MSKVQRVHHFLHQNIAAKIFLYSLAMVVPVMNGLLYLEVLDVHTVDIGFFLRNPYYLNWVGFYSCVLLIWAYRKKAPTLVCTIVLLNFGPMGFWCFFALIGGLNGVLLALSTLAMPAFIIAAVDSVFVAKLLMWIGLITLVSILAFGVWSFFRRLKNHE